MPTKNTLTGTLRYWIREDKMLSNGSCPLFIIYSLHGERTYYNTGVKLFREQWDLKSEQIKPLSIKAAKDFYKLDIKDIPTKENVKDDADRISKLISDIRKIEQRFEIDNLPYTSKHVIDNLRAAKPPKPRKKDTTVTHDEDETPTTYREQRDFISIKNWMEYVPAFIAKFCKDNPTLKDISLVKNKRTLQLYKNVARDLMAFEKAEKQKPVFANMNRDYMSKFFDYVVRENGNNNITGSKKISTLKTLLRFATMDGYGYKLEVNPDYKEYYVTRTDNRNEVVALTLDEYKAIRNIQLEDPILSHARDIFIFSCNTGLRVSDLETLKKEHIHNGTISKNIKKTKERNTIPLNKTAKEILTTYNNDPQELMSMHRNEVNVYIKEVAKLAGIDAPVEKVREYGKEEKTIMQPKYERISNHIGRKSFVTMMLAKGVSIPDVMALSGHKSMKSFQRYVDVSKEQREAAINRLDDE